MGVVIAVVVIVVLLALLGFGLAVRIIRQYEQGVLCRLGRLRGSRAPGFRRAAARGPADGGLPSPAGDPARPSRRGGVRLRLQRPARRPAVPARRAALPAGDVPAARGTAPDAGQ